MTLIVTLFLAKGNWWEITLLAWFASILLFWGFFSVCVIYLEVTACLLLMEEDDQSSLKADDGWGVRCRYWARKADEACVRTMKYRLSGTRTYVERRDQRTKPRIAEKLLPSRSLYSWIASKEWNPCFYQQSPRKIQTLDEMLGNTFYVTNHSWSLERLFCRIRHATTITQGESSITEAQINSNIACNLLGNVFIAMLFTGTIVWFELPPIAHCA